MKEDVIDRIYEAAVNAELWPAVLDDMAQIAGAEGGVLFAAGTGAPQWTSSQRMRPHMEDFVQEGWAARNDRSDAAFRKRLPGFVNDYDMMSPEAVEASPIYREFFRPRGLGWSVGTAIVPMTGDVFVLSLERRFERGLADEAVKDRLDPLRPHLARSALTAARFGLEYANGTVRGLEMIGLAAAVLTADGRIVAANRPFEAMPDLVSFGGFGRIALKDPAAGGALHLALSNLGRGGAALRLPLSFAMRIDDSTPAVGHLIPLVATARDIFKRGDALLILTRIGQPTIPGATLLEAIFDLTPTEARVARKLIEGVRPAEIAREASVTHETIRSHMKAIFRKTGVERQLELVRLMAGLPGAT